MTSDMSNFASLKISGNLFRVSSILRVVSFVEVKTVELGNTFETDFASAPRTALTQNTNDIMTLNVLSKGI
jgi:hypothetical protein